jgi:hypothetical protein
MASIGDFACVRARTQSAVFTDSGTVDCDFHSTFAAAGAAVLSPR